MPKIITNSKNHEKEKIDPLQRSNFLDKNDLKTTFAYGIVTITVSFALWGLLTSYYKQITK